MKKICFLIFFLIYAAISAQAVKAITEDGIEIVLLENGTWRFVNESDAKTLETISTNKNEFVKSADATFRIKSSKMNVAVYYNPKIWYPTKREVQHMEYHFFSDGAYGSLTTEKAEIRNLKMVKEIMISNVQDAADYFRLKESEYRTVNGKKMLYMRYIANVKGLDFEYAGYYFINDAGFAMVVGYTHQKDFEEKFPLLQSFLNGFVETDPNEKTQTVEVIREYTNPPPPAKWK